MELTQIAMDKILIPRRVRLDRRVDDEFLYSVRTQGILQPITVAPAADRESFILVHGLRRYIAANMSGFKNIDAIVDEQLKSKDILMLEPVYNWNKRYILGELVQLANHIEATHTLSTPSEYDALLGLKEGNYLKLKAVMEYSEEQGDIEELLANDKDEPNMLIEKAFKKMERDKKKKEKDDGKPEGSEEFSGGHDEFVDDMDEGPTQPEVPDELMAEILIRDQHMCRCRCGIVGSVYDSIYKGYTIKNPLFGGAMVEKNVITVCPNCYSLTVQYALGNLMIREEEKDIMKEIIRYGEVLKHDIIDSGRPLDFYRDYFRKVL